MADALDSKSSVRKDVSVRVRLPAPTITDLSTLECSSPFVIRLGIRAILLGKF